MPRPHLRIRTECRALSGSPATSSSSTTGKMTAGSALARQYTSAFLSRWLVTMTIEAHRASSVTDFLESHVRTLQHPRHRSDSSPNDSPAAQS